MEQIKLLLEKCGIRPELGQKICEALDSYTAAYKHKVDAEYAARVEAAKKICIEETEAHKLELARRLQIFCEAKGMQIEQQISRQAAVREGEATTLLQQITALLEGIPATGDPALRQEVERLRRQSTGLAEERNKAVEKANRQTQLAERVLKRNRLLESKQVEQETGGRQPARRTVVEGAVRGNGTGGRRIDAQRRAGQARTTRAPLVENQDPRPPVDQRRSHLQTGKMTNGNLTPDQIADQIDEMP